MREAGVAVWPGGLVWVLLGVDGGGRDVRPSKESGKPVFLVLLLRRDMVEEVSGRDGMMKTESVEDQLTWEVLRDRPLNLSMVGCV